MNEPEFRKESFDTVFGALSVHLLADIDTECSEKDNPPGGNGRH